MKVRRLVMRRRVLVLLLAAIALVAGGFAYAVFSPSGLISATIPLDDSNVQSVAIDEATGKVFVALSLSWTNPAVLVVDVQADRIERTIRTTLAVPPQAIAPVIALDAHAERVFVPQDRGSRWSIGLFDDRDGHVVARVPIEGNPYALAVDERAGRLVATVSEDANNPAHAVHALVIDIRQARVVTNVRLDTVSNELPTLSVDDRTGQAYALSDAGIDVFREIGVRSVSRLRIGATLSNLVIDTHQHLAFVPGDANTPYVRAIDLRTGRERYRFACQAFPSSDGSGAIDAVSGRIIYTDVGLLQSEPLMVRDEKTGRLIARVQVGPHAHVVATDTIMGRVYVATQRVDTTYGSQIGEANFMPVPGTISVLDARTGRIMGAITVGCSPTRAVLDNRSHKLFVLERGGSVATTDPWPWRAFPTWLRDHIPFAPPRERGGYDAGADIRVVDTSRL